MNDFDPSLDEIVSAYVDGAATPDERARVESDPTLVERAATFRAIHDAVAAADAPTGDDLRRALISRALAETAPTLATVHTLRRRRATTLGPIVAAAAVIAVFFGLGTWLVASQENDDTGSETASFAADEDSFNPQSGLRAPSSSTAGIAGAGTATPESAPTGEISKAAPSYLGGFADEVALRHALISARDGTATSSPPTTLAARTAGATSDTASCTRTDPAGATVYAAELRGRPVTVVVAGTQAHVFDNATCQRTPLELPPR